MESAIGVGWAVELVGIAVDHLCKRRHPDHTVHFGESHQQHDRLAVAHSLGLKQPDIAVDECQLQRLEVAAVMIGNHDWPPCSLASIARTSSRLMALICASVSAGTGISMSVVSSITIWSGLTGLAFSDLESCWPENVLMQTGPMPCSTESAALSLRPQTMQRRYFSVSSLARS